MNHRSFRSLLATMVVLLAFCVETSAQMSPSSLWTHSWIQASLMTLRPSAYAPAEGAEGLRATDLTDKGHKHTYAKVATGKKWVPPKKVRKIIGYTKDGQPIYGNVTVQKGYWKKTYVTKCTVCGKKQ